MIYTVTVNPALDYVLQLPEVKDGETNRSSDTQFLAGGKGINVSQILNQLGVDNTAWGFVGGFYRRRIDPPIERQEDQQRLRKNQRRHPGER